MSDTDTRTRDMAVLAAIIEIVSGTSYNDYLRQAILLPLGLREAYFRDEKVPGLALGYQTPPDNPEPATNVPLAWDHGAGGMTISVPDLHMAFKGLRSGKVLSRENLEIMFHPWPEEGYGWHVRKDAGGRRLGVPFPTDNRLSGICPTSHRQDTLSNPD